MRLGQQLKMIRQAHGMSAQRAAELADVSCRTWRAWETDKSSERDPSPASVRLFFVRANIPIPDCIRRALRTRQGGQVISITSHKGGVGKSPISINVAACLVSKGMRVALISNDFVYRSMTEAGEGAEPGTLVSQIAIHDFRDVLFAPSEITTMKKELAVNYPTEAERSAPGSWYPRQAEELERKRHASVTLSQLVANYDYVLLDMFNPLKLIREHANIIALILDSRCITAVWSAKRFIEKFNEIPSRRKQPIIFGLLTRYDIGGKSPELIEYLGNRKDVGMAAYEKLRQARDRLYEHREQVFQEIKSLPLILLNTRMTDAHEIVIDRYDEVRPLMEGYCYFHSIPDIAPDSPAAEECNRLTDELIDVRL